MKGFRTATMFNQLFPQRADNTYRGYKFALWLFAVVLLLRGFQSLVSVFKGYSTLTVADGIPLDRYTTAGAQTLVSMFAILGFTAISNLPAGRIGLGSISQSGSADVYAALAAISGRKTDSSPPSGR